MRPGLLFACPRDDVPNGVTVPVNDLGVRTKTQQLHRIPTQSSAFAQVGASYFMPRVFVKSGRWLRDMRLSEKVWINPCFIFSSSCLLQKSSKV